MIETDNKNAAWKKAVIFKYHKAIYGLGGGWGCEVVIDKRGDTTAQAINGIAYSSPEYMRWIADCMEDAKVRIIDEKWELKPSVEPIMTLTCEETLSSLLEHPNWGDAIGTLAKYREDALDCFLAAVKQAIVGPEDAGELEMILDHTAECRAIGVEGTFRQHDNWPQQESWQKAIDESIARGRACGYIYNGDKFTYGKDTYEVIAGGLDSSVVQYLSTPATQQFINIKRIDNDPA